MAFVKILDAERFRDYLHLRGGRPTYMAYDTKGGTGGLEGMVLKIPDYELEDMSSLSESGYVREVALVDMKNELTDRDYDDFLDEERDLLWRNLFPNEVIRVDATYPNEWTDEIYRVIDDYDIDSFEDGEEPVSPEISRVSVMIARKDIERFRRDLNKVAVAHVNEYYFPQQLL